MRVLFTSSGPMFGGKGRPVAWERVVDSDRIVRVRHVFTDIILQLPVCCKLYDLNSTGFYMN